MTVLWRYRDKLVRHFDSMTAWLFEILKTNTSCWLFSPQHLTENKQKTPWLFTRRFWVNIVNAFLFRKTKIATPTFLMKILIISGCLRKFDFLLLRLLQGIRFLSNYRALFHSKSITRKNSTPKRRSVSLVRSAALLTKLAAISVAFSKLQPFSNSPHKTELKASPVPE